MTERREIVLARWDNRAENQNVMKSGQAAQYGIGYLGQKLISRIWTSDSSDGYVSSQAMLVKDVELRRCVAIPSQGRIVALCEPFSRPTHRRLKKWERTA